MGETAADGAAVADLVMGYVIDHELEQGMCGREPVILLDLAPAHARSDPQSPGREADLIHAAKSLDIDQQRRVCHPEREQRQQALTT